MAPSSTSPLFFHAANSPLLHLPLAGAPTTIPANLRQDPEEAAAAAATDLPVVDVMRIAQIPTDLVRCRDHDLALAHQWLRLEETGGIVPGHALGLPGAALLAREVDVVEEEEAVVEVEGTTWITGDVGVLAALVMMIAGAGAAVAAAIGTDVRCIPRAGILQGQASSSRRMIRTQDNALTPGIVPFYGSLTMQRRRKNMEPELKEEQYRFPKERYRHGPL